MPDSIMSGSVSLRTAGAVNEPKAHLTRAQLVEACRADLDRAFIRGGGNLGAYTYAGSYGIAALQRTPHEQAAARVVNAHLHMVGLEYPMRMALQRKDRETFDGYRPQLRRALAAYRKAGREYREMSP